MNISIGCTDHKYVCASEKMKLIGSVSGLFPDFGHHLENEMGGLWMPPIKLLDGFWMRFCDHTAKTVDCWIQADRFINFPYGNRFEYKNGLGNTEIEIIRTQYAPEERSGIVVSYEFFNTGERHRQVTAEFLARADLRPVWFSETIHVLPGSRDNISWLSDKNAYHVWDNEHEWHVLFGSDVKPSSRKSGQLIGPENTHGKGTGGSLSFDFDLYAHQRKIIRFFIAGSLTSLADCLSQLHELKNYSLLENKKRHCRMIANQSRLRLYGTAENKKFEQIFEWIKYDTDWLAVNAGKFGHGLTAGLPEYPWWFGCDSCYAVQGLLATGRFELCRDTLKVILDTSIRKNGDGRIIHEVTTDGAVPNAGNTQETAHFVIAVWSYYQWTGDQKFLRYCLPYLKKSVKWLQHADDDDDLFPSGYGIIEIAGLNFEMIDSAVYTWEAFSDWAKICRLEKEEKEAQKYESLAWKLKDAVNKEFWSEKNGLYCDCVASAAAVERNLNRICESLQPEQTEKFAESLEKEIAEQPDKQKEKGWLLGKNWVIAIPMEMGIAPKEKAEKSLRRLYTSEFVGEYGMFLRANGSATMTISTGVLAVAQARYGYEERAMDLIERIFRSFSMATPGSISEMSPDYGCFAQAWTIYGVMVTVVNYFFGIQPCASNGCLMFDPHMPMKWCHTTLDNVRVMGCSLDISFFLSGKKEFYQIRNHGPETIKIIWKNMKRPLSLKPLKTIHFNRHPGCALNLQVSELL